MEPPESHFRSAAEGWLMLGNIDEANAELAKFGPTWQTHPEVLELRWQIAAAGKHWQQGIDIANQLVSSAPDQPTGYIHRSFSLHELKRTQEAWDLLLPAVEQFPNEPIIPYNLACYACQLGLMDLARRWLSYACSIGDRAHIKQMALADPDLIPLQPEINRLAS